MRHIVPILSLLAFLGKPCDVLACIERAWSFEILQNEADVVVVVEAISTADTGRIAPIEKWVSTSRDGKQEPVLGAAIETRFKVLAVLKGTVSPEFAVTLYKERVQKSDDGKVIGSICGPGYREFDPKSHTRYLLFLKSAPGEISLVGGQTQSIPAIVKLDGGPYF